VTPYHVVWFLRRFEDQHVRAVRNILLSTLIAALSFLAAWILTVNLDVTWHSFEHQEVTRQAAFRLAFLVAILASVIVFSVALYRLQNRRAPPKSSL
jgi:hypothetical protein